MSPAPSCFLRIPASVMLRRGAGAMVGAPWNCDSLPSGPDDGLHVCMSAYATGCIHARKTVRPVSPKVGCRRDPWSGHAALERPIASMLDILPACLSASLPVRTIGQVLCLAQARGHKTRRDQVTTLKPSTVTPPQSPALPPLPGKPFSSGSRVLLGAPSCSEGNLGKAQGFKALDPFGLALNGGLTAGAQGCSRRASRRPLTPYGVLTGCPVSAGGLLFGGAETGR
jgi:hypothetical protein